MGASDGNRRLAFPEPKLSSDGGPSQERKNGKTRALIARQCQMTGAGQVIRDQSLFQHFSVNLFETTYLLILSLIHTLFPSLLLSLSIYLFIDLSLSLSFSFFFFFFLFCCCCCCPFLPLPLFLCNFANALSCLFSPDLNFFFVTRLLIKI